MDKMPIMEPSIMIDQVESLPELIEDHVEKFDVEVRKFFQKINGEKIDHIYITGCGDSYHAALASEMAFEKISKINCEAINGLRFLDYTSEHLLPNSIVVGVSASGGSARIVEAVKRVDRSRGVSVSITGNAESPIAKNTDYVIHVDIPFMGRSPGVRTYEASLLGLYLTAIRLGEYQGQVKKEEASGLVEELAGLSDIVLKANQACQAVSKKAAQNFKDSPAVLFLGSGPNFGTAVFSAAKICESCGVISFGQDLEEFAHVEGLCYPDDMPVIVFAAKGKSHWRAVEIANYAKTLGKRVMVVAESDDDILKQDFDFSIAMPAYDREEFSPLYYHVISDYLSGYLTEALGRKLFRSDQNRTSAALGSNIQTSKRKN